MAAMLWIGISRTDDNFAQTRGNERIGAGRSASMGGARFKGNVEGRASGVLPALFGIADGFDFGMRFAGAAMPAAPNDPAVPDQDRADQRIGRSLAVSAPRQAQRSLHKNQIKPGNHGTLRFREQSVGELFRIKGLQILRLFAQANKFKDRKSVV